MSDTEKRAHDIAVAVMQENIRPLHDKEDFNEYMSSCLGLYFAAFSSADTALKDRAG